MLHQLNQAHDEEVKTFLSTAPGFALFIIGDIENFGYDSSFQDIWGDRDDHGALRAVLLRYYTNYVIYAPGRFDAKAVSDEIQKNNKWTNVNGWSEAVRASRSLYGRRECTGIVLCGMQRVGNRISGAGNG